MATIVVHGTMTLLSAKHARWWWDSWHEGGFLQAVSHGMESISGSHDVWTVGGRSVREITEWHSGWFTHPDGIFTHQGHFAWSGADMYAAREAGAEFLVKYLNRLVAYSPGEPVSIIAHSHGCNVVKMASSLAGLSRDVYIEQAVFLACPHFFSQGPQEEFYAYRLDPSRFGRILNLSSETDSIQVGMADTLPGLPGARWTDYLPPQADRVEHDAQAAPLYENWTIPTEDSGMAAHSSLHGEAVGSLVGIWLAGRHNFGDILDQGGDQFLPVPRGDHGA